MKKSLILICLCWALTAQSQDLNYYLPDSVQYDPRIPKPSEVIHHEVGEWHVTHDRLVNYMQAVATANPSRVKLETMGYTYENRPQVLLIITSPKNHARLEEIRQAHVQLTDPERSASLDLTNMPVVVWIGHSIHGNEQSGSNASLVSAYHLAAAQGRQIEELLDNTVILFDPSFNPDGMQRFSTWVNQHRSKNLVSDPNSREFNEVWPGGRFNHYWFDLNRDWLPAVHVESQNRLRWFHRWKPNVLTDHHEQGSNATFFFQPGVPSRVNPLTPKLNQELTAELAKFHAKYLDRIGSLYFTRENYDDFYYGKGSTYPDVQGSIGILFEQASSRGHLQQTSNGPLSFPFTIRNQFVTALSTLEGAAAMRIELLKYQRNFFQQAVRESKVDPVKGYRFSSDSRRAGLFIEMLRRHQIEVYGDTNDDNNYIVPVSQPQYKLIRTIFEKATVFEDSLFYDITTWTMPLAFGLEFAPLNDTELKKYPLWKKVESANVPSMVIGKSQYGYILSWNDFHAPAALYALQHAGLQVKVSTEPLSVTDHAGRRVNFPRGSLFIPVQQQPFLPDSVYQLVSRTAVRYSVMTQAVHSSTTLGGIELGSGKLQAVSEPVIAMITGSGVNALDAGETWHLLDQRMNIPVSHLDIPVFNRVDLEKYNTIIMVSGSYPDLNKDKLKQWVERGGVLILMEDAINWAAQNSISSVKFRRAKAPADSLSRLSYASRSQVEGAQQVQGAIFSANADLTHPLAFGYTSASIPFFKGNRVFMEKSKNPYATPFLYGNAPKLSGWVSRENLDAIKNSAAVIVQTLGSGRVIHISENPNFRAFWLGGTKLFMNAIFFGRNIDAASARADE